MKCIARLWFLAVSLLNALPAGAASDAPQILLCIDGAKPAALEEVLVYTYIDGKKTECMPRSELLALCSRKKKDTADPATSDKIRIVDSCKLAYREQASPAGKDLRMRDYKDAKLPGFDFSNANLESADFRGADLRNANFTNAKLRAAYFKGADLRGADLTGADIYGVYMNKADLRGIQGFSIDGVRIVNTLYEAVFDTTFREEIEYCCKDKIAKASWYWHNNAWADYRAKKRAGRSARNPPRKAQAPTLE